MHGSPSPCISARLGGLSVPKPARLQHIFFSIYSSAYIPQPRRAGMEIEDGLLLRPLPKFGAAGCFTACGGLAMGGVFSTAHKSRVPSSSLGGCVQGLLSGSGVAPFLHATRRIFIPSMS